MQTAPLQHGEQARLAHGVALASGPVIFAQGEQRWLWRGRRRLGAAKRHQVAPQPAQGGELSLAQHGADQHTHQ
jgi:hypothetical protein